MLLWTSYIVNNVNKKFDRQSKENFNAKTEIRKDKSKTRDIPNKKKNTESLTTKARIGRKEREQQWKKRNVNGVVHMFRPFEYGNDRIQRLFLWHTLKTFELLAALYQLNSSKKQKQNNKQNTRCLWQTCDIPSNAQRPLSILTAIANWCPVLSAHSASVSVLTYLHRFHAPFAVGWLVRFVFGSLVCLARTKQFHTYTLGIDSILWFHFNAPHHTWQCWKRVYKVLLLKWVICLCDWPNRQLPWSLVRQTVFLFGISNTKISYTSMISII